MGYKQEGSDDARLGLFTGHWVVRKGSQFLGSCSEGYPRDWYHNYMSAFVYRDKVSAVRSAVICQRLHPMEKVYVEYRMSDADHNVPRIRDYLCYVGCSDDGHGGDITRGGLPILSYEEWMEA